MARGALVCLLLGLVALGANSQNVSVPCTPITDAAEAAGLTTLLAALEAANLVDAVTAQGATLTVFAPTNEGFDDALAALGLTLPDLVDNTELLTNILLYHVLPVPLTVDELIGENSVDTLLGDDSPCGVGNLTVDAGESLMIIGGETSASVMIPDIETCSGVVHAIDFVLLPCPLAGSADAPAPGAEDDDTTLADAEAPAPGVEEVNATDPGATTVVDDQQECMTVVEAANEAGLTTLLAALEAANLVEAIAAETELTIFAPMNTAFDNTVRSLGITIDDLVSNPEVLIEVLVYHVLPDPFRAADFGDGGTFETLLGGESSCGVDTVVVEVGDAVTVVGGQTSAAVVVADVETCSGVVHVIDSVLLPCPLTANGAEDEEPGEGSAEVPEVPEPADGDDGGVTNVTQPNLNVVPVATDLGLTTFVELVQAAEVVSAVESGNLTIFAPTNEAFTAALAQQNLTLDALLADPSLLQEILAYHVVPGAVTAAEFGDGGTFETVAGTASGCNVSSVDVVVGEDGSVTIVGGETEAQVVTADVEAGTTVIHVIDNVLLACPLTGDRRPQPPPPSPRKKKTDAFIEFFCFLFFFLC